MKQVISLLLALTLILGLCACGNDATSAQPAATPVADPSPTVEPAAKEDSATMSMEDMVEVETEELATDEEDTADLISFEDVVLLDNETVTVELTCFYEEYMNWDDSDGGPRTEKCIGLNVTNNSTAEINVYVTAYLQDETLYTCMSGGSSSPAPGKSGKLCYSLDYDTIPHPTELESLDTLYDVELAIEVYRYDTYSTDTVFISLYDAIYGTMLAPAVETDEEDDFKDSLLYQQIYDIIMDSGSNVNMDYDPTTKRLYSYYEAPEGTRTSLKLNNSTIQEAWDSLIASYQDLGGTTQETLIAAGYSDISSVICMVDALNDSNIYSDDDFLLIIEGSTVVYDYSQE